MVGPFSLIGAPFEGSLFFSEDVEDFYSCDEAVLAKQNKEFRK